MPTVLTTKNSDCAAFTRSVQISDERLMPFRYNRTLFLQRLAGMRYGPNPVVGWLDYLNLMYHVSSTLEPELCPERVLSSVEGYAELRPIFEDTFRLAIDRMAEKLNVPFEVGDAAMNSLVGMGMTKTHCPGALPDVKSISLDDYIVDWRTRTRREGEVCYQGHRFRMRLDDALEHPEIGRKGKDIIATLGEDMVQQRSRADKIGGATGEHMDVWGRVIELVEIEIRKNNGDRRCIWIPGNWAAGTDYIREFDWYGPPMGAYRALGMTWLPDNSMPVPPLATTFDISELLNRLVDKIAWDEEHAKRIAAINGNSPTVAKDAQQARSGSVLYTGNQPLDVKTIDTGGSDPKRQATVAWLAEWKNQIDGNINLLGGDKAKEPTLGQSQLLEGNASQRLTFMAGKVAGLAEGIIQSLAWYMWHDPAPERGEEPDIDISARRTVGGFSHAVNWQSGGEREGDFEDYRIGASLRLHKDSTPAAKYNRLCNMIERIILPLSPVAAQQGLIVKVDKLFEAATRSLDDRDLDDILEQGEPQQQGPSKVISGQAGPQQAQARSNIHDQMAAASSRPQPQGARNAGQK